MESKNKPMDYREWLGSRRIDSFSTIDEIAEQYAQYRLSFVPPDIEKAIEEKYPRECNEGARTSAVIGNFDKRDAARFGYSLSSAQILGLNREPVRMVFDYCQNDEGYGCVGCLGDGKGDCAAVMKPVKPVELSSGWVSVKDALPENDVPVIAVWNGRVHLMELTILGYWIIARDEYRIGRDGITHWMPLPHPPITHQ